MTTPLEVARARYRTQKILTGRARVQARRAWLALDPDNLTASWERRIGGLLADLTGLQHTAASGADEYQRRMMAAQNADTTPAGSVNPRAFSGVASDGRDLDSLMYQPVIQAKSLIGDGRSDAQALRTAGQSFVTMAAQQVTDAGRVADGLATFSNAHTSGFYRMLQPPSCSRCAILAGKFFRKNQGFQRHPRCFPAGTVVSGPKVLGATRRWYEGELVTIRTASGQELAMTGNHPVLTSDGWVPANFLVEGGDVVRRASGDRAVGLEVPDEDQMPARIEDVWSSSRMGALSRVPVAPEDFHGDGVAGHVDVVFADSLLWNRIESALLEQSGQQNFTLRPELAVALSGASPDDQLLSGHYSLSRSRLSWPGLLHQDLAWRSTNPHESRGAAVADRHVSINQALPYDVAADPDSSGDGVLTLAPDVTGDDRSVIQHPLTPRWDAPAGPLTMQSRVGYARRGKDLLLRLARQVETDRIVQATRVQWSGHVYNLTSSEGWFDANGLIVSNCDCVHIPCVEADDSLAFDARKAVEQGQVTGLSGNETRAILDGAAPSQVVNARRGMDPAGLYTREGTTRRGIAGARIITGDPTAFIAPRFGGDLVAGDRFTRLTKTGRTQTYNYRRARTPRPTPEAIYRFSADRDEALTLLKRFGYLL